MHFQLHFFIFFNFVWEVCFVEHTWEELNKQACLSSLSYTNLGHAAKYGGTHILSGWPSHVRLGKNPKIGLLSRYTMKVFE